jgi:cytosine/adenosine deaminase-related metal-dependent hydrolase
MAMALRSAFPGAFETVVGDFALARELEVPITVHSGFRWPGAVTRDITDMHELGLLGGDVTCVHCSDISDTEIGYLAAAGVHVSMSPFCEMVMGLGNPPTGRMLEQGIRPSLSVDVATTVPGDMFTQMRTAYAAERARAFTPDTFAPYEPTLTPQDVLAAATIDAAHGCGLGDRVGSLTPGKRADIVLLRTDRLNTMPVIDPVATAVLFADTSNVDTVLVDGAIVKRDGQMLGHDLPRLFAQGEDSREHLVSCLAQ